MRTRRDNAIRTTLSAALLIAAVAMYPTPSLSGTGRDEVRLAPNGELVGPLPESPELRRAALENAARMATTRSAASTGVRYNVSPERLDATLLAPVRAASVAPGAGPREEGLPIPEVDQTSSGTAAIFHLANLPALGGNVTPADLNLAVDEDYIVTADNDNGFLIYDKCGTWLYYVSLDSIISTGTNYGVRIQWEEFYKAFIFSFLNVDFGSSTARVYFGYAVDPTGTWQPHYIESNTYFYDYVDITTDGDKFFLTANQFTFAGAAFAGSTLLTADKFDFYDGGSTSLYLYALGTNPANGQLMSAVRTVHMHSWGGIQYLINSEPSGGNFLTLTEVSGTPSTLSFNKRTIPTGAYTVPPNALQSDGTYVEAGDARLNDAAYYNGSLWAVGTTTLPSVGGDEGTTIFYRIVTAGADVVSQSNYAGIPGDGRVECYPSVDIDGSNRAFIAYSQISETENAAMGAESWSTSSYLGGWITPGLDLAHGAGSGTVGDPYRWGNYSGVAREWPDQNLVYITGMIGNNGSDDWYNYLAVGTDESPGGPVFTPPANLTMTGEQGGPFTPSSLTFNIQNTGGTDGFWKATLIPSFLVVPTTVQRIVSGASDNVVFPLDPAVNSYPPGVYTETLTLRNCFSGYSFPFEVTLVVGENTDCHAATVNLIPDVPADGNALAPSTEHGLFVTAITDYYACGIGIQADLPPGTTVLTRVYAADGNSRGALLFVENRFSYQTGVNEHYVPVSFQFEGCRDYEITAEVSDVNVWQYWNETSIDGPIDHHGLIRGRVGSVNGQAAGLRPYLTLLGVELPCDNTTDLIVAGQTPQYPPVMQANRGMYVIPKRTMRLCGVGFRTHFTSSTFPRVKVYNVGFAGRGDLLAQGEAGIISGSLTEHWVPIDVVLEQGYIYDLSVEYDGTLSGIEVLDESAITLPYDVGDVMLVGDGEVNGDASNPYLPYLEIGWEEVGGGVFMGTSPSTGTASVGTTAYTGRGMYIEPLYDHQIYAVGWEADVPLNEALTVSVYDGTGGVQGSLIAEKTIFSGQPGMRWHDVPLALDLLAGTVYNVVVTWNAMNGYTQWTGASYPYTPYDQFDVLGASDQNGAPASEMVHLRYRTCGGRSGSVTGAGDHPVRVPMALAPPSPNPTGGLTTLRFQMEEEGPATLAVYDVAGRRVRDIVRGTTMTAGAHTLPLDTSGLPSGIYFVRFETPRAVLTRKLVVNR